MLALRTTTPIAGLDAALADFDTFRLDEEGEILAGLEIRTALH